MKKYFFIILFFLSIPAYALCPIDADGESVCSMQNFESKAQPLFQTQTPSINNSQNKQGVQNPLMQFNNEQSINQTRFQSENEKNINKNLNCQFGLCPQNFNNQPQQK